MSGFFYLTYFVPLIINKMIIANKKKIAKNNTDHCIEPVIAIKNPKTNINFPKSYF